MCKRAQTVMNRLLVSEQFNKVELRIVHGFRIYFANSQHATENVDFH